MNVIELIFKLQQLSDEDRMKPVHDHEGDEILEVEVDSAGVRVSA